MKPIIIVMLAVVAAMLVTVVYTVTMKAPTEAQRRPFWSSLAISLLVVGGTSLNIGDSHEGASGADLLELAGTLLMGMGLMALLVQFRLRRGVGDRAAT